MFWERVTEEIYVFTSDRYALVNSIAILTEEGVVVVDALPFPDEAKQIAAFLEARGRGRFHSIILTHYHMDHVYGLFAFPDHLDVISHELCRKKLLEVGERSLEQARQSDAIFDEVTLRLPTITFDEGELLLAAGNKHFRLMHLPGHSMDNIGVFLEDERILFAGDSVMAIPIIADGDWRQSIQTLHAIKELSPETIVQGHGEVILRGEVQSVLDSYIKYLQCVETQARKVLDKNKPRSKIWDISLETCGLERVPLGVASHQLHVANILRVYDVLKAEREAAEESA